MPNENFIFQCKKGTTTAICSCGEELFTDYYDEAEGVLECPKCHQKYNIKEFEENAQALIRSLLTLFPKEYSLKEPSLKPSEEGFGETEDEFWLFNDMVRKITEWKKKAEYYDKIHKFAKIFTDSAYFNLCFVNPQLQQFLTCLAFSVSYEKNHNETNKLTPIEIY